MTTEERENLIRSIKDLFNSDRLVNAIDIDSLIPLNLITAQNDINLNRFFSLDENGPFTEIIQRGAQSLRKGFYKIITQPYYRTSFVPGTFAADVYYINEYDTIYKYHANIGPLTNTSMKPFSMNDSYKTTPIPILQKFLDDKRQYGFAQDYMVAKRNFFNSVFNEDRIFCVRNSIWDPAYPNINRRKQVNWCFIDF